MVVSMIIDNDDFTSVEPVIEKEVTPKDLLIFAKLILSVLAGLFLIGIVSDLFKPEIHIFDTCKTILPPIATLVIGFYFGKSN